MTLLPFILTPSILGENRWSLLLHVLNEDVTWDNANAMLLSVFTGVYEPAFEVIADWRQHQRESRPKVKRWTWDPPEDCHLSSKELFMCRCWPGLFCCLAQRVSCDGLTSDDHTDAHWSINGCLEGDCSQSFSGFYLKNLHDHHDHNHDYVCVCVWVVFL